MPFPVVGGLLVGGALAYLADRSRRTASASPGASVGGGSSRGEPRPTYFELMRRRAAKKQGKQTARWNVLDERNEREAKLAAEAERLRQQAARREGGAAQLQARTGEREASASARYAAPEQDASAVYAAPEGAAADVYGLQSGLLYVGQVDRGELKAARQLETVAEDERRASGRLKTAARHELRATRAERLAGEAERSDVREARKDFRGARKDLHVARHGETAAERIVRKERAEVHAATRQARAQRTEAGIEQGLTDFETQAPADGVYDNGVAADLYRDPTAQGLRYVGRLW